VVVSSVLLASVALASASECKSSINLHQHNKDGKTWIEAKNRSGKPIVAYVVQDMPTLKTDYRTYSLRGVFTNGDAMKPGSSMNLGTVQRQKKTGIIRVDYIRFSDGSTCGHADTTEAQAISARFPDR
jgi:hypothetical protein